MQRKDGVMARKSLRAPATNVVRVRFWLGARFSKVLEVYKPEATCMKGTSVHSKNVCLKQLRYHKV